MGPGGAATIPWRPSLITRGSAGFLASGLGWKLPHPASCLTPSTRWPGLSPCTGQVSPMMPRRRSGSGLPLVVAALPAPGWSD